jgi:hypothetical protein
MTSKLLELEGTWEEILLQSERLVGHRIKVTILPDEELTPTPEDSFRQAWQEIKEGKVRPISELWEGIDAE